MGGSCSKAASRSSSASSARATTASAKRSRPVPESAAKPGSPPVATLYGALDGRGAGGEPLAALRARARAAYDSLELPYWRRSGFWQTSFVDLDLAALQPIEHAQAQVGLPEIVAERANAGVLVQRDG